MTTNPLQSPSFDGAAGSATNDPPCCDACGLEYALREGDDVSRFCDPCYQSAFMRLESVAKQAVDLILKSEQTGWCKHATAAKELLEAALGQSPNAAGEPQPTCDSRKP